MLQAALSAFEPALLGFAGEREARAFYAQAGIETLVIATTDFTAPLCWPESRQPARGPRRALRDE